MAKTAKIQGTIMLEETKAANLNQLMRRVFYKSPSRQVIATKMFQMILDGSFNKVMYSKICEDLNITPGIYYDILNCLRGRGMIHKIDSEWRISGDFLTRLEDLIEVYEELTKFRCKWRR